MSAGRRTSTWLAGRKTFTPMSTSSPPLIFRVATPVTTSPSWTVSITFSQASIFSAFRLLSVIMPRESSTRPWMSSTSSMRTLTMVPGSGSSSPSSHSLRKMIPSLLYPTSTSTTSPSTRRTRPSTILFSSISWVVQAISSAGTPSSADSSSCCHSSSVRSNPRIRLRLTMKTDYFRRTSTHHQSRSPGPLTSRDCPRACSGRIRYSTASAAGQQWRHAMFAGRFRIAPLPGHCASS